MVRADLQVTAENVDLRDLVDFARDMDFEARDALSHVVTFAATVMTNVGATDLLRRVDLLARGLATTAPSWLDDKPMRAAGH
jgi:DNA helicase-2/ATP-dependent DNA helicase PcrA